MKNVIIIILIIILASSLFFNKKQYDEKTNNIELYTDSININKQKIDSIELIITIQQNKLDSLDNVIINKQKLYEKERKKLLDNINNINSLTTTQQFELLTKNLNSISN